MRILLLAQFFPPDIGGEERHVYNLARTLASRGHNVSVGTQRMDGVPDEEVIAPGVRVYRFGTMAMRLPGVYTTNRMHHLPTPDPLVVRELARIVRQENPEIIHAHNWIVNSALPLRHRIRPGHHFGLVLTLHDYSHVCATKRLLRKGRVCPGPAVARCLPCAVKHYSPIVGPVTVAATAGMRVWRNRSIDHIVSVSRAVANANGIPEGPGSSIIPNFVPDSSLATLTPQQASSAADVGSPEIPRQPFLLFVGDLSAEKGIDTLLRAYRALGPDRPPLLLIGRRTTDELAVLPEGAEMHFEWPHDHVLFAFEHCLAAILPSVWPDPCPTTVLEAMAARRAVVSTATGGIVDMIVDGESGLLVPPGDEHALEAALARIIGDAELRDRLGANAQEQVRAFTASAVAERLEAVYVRAARSRSVRSATPRTDGVAA